MCPAPRARSSWRSSFRDRAGYPPARLRRFRRGATQRGARPPPDGSWKSGHSLTRSLLLDSEADHLQGVRPLPLGRTGFVDILQAPESEGELADLLGQGHQLGLRRVEFEGGGLAG